MVWFCFLKQRVSSDYAAGIFGEHSCATEGISVIRHPAGEREPWKGSFRRPRTTAVGLPHKATEEETPRSHNRRARQGRILATLSATASLPCGDAGPNTIGERAGYQTHVPHSSTGHLETFAECAGSVYTHTGH